MSEDGFTYVPMLDVDGESDGPGVYVPAGAEEAFREICANNARLLGEDAARAAAQGGEPA